VHLAVFCGASPNVDPRLLVSARVVGQLAVERGFSVVYGGASTGLMGAVADGALAAGGEVIGVLPQMLVNREVAHRSLTRLEVVQTLHQRKARMAELASAFAILPGGFGTLDEAFEIVTWRMLGIHQKPIAFLDALGFWKPLQALVEHLAAQRFVGAGQSGLVQLCPTPDTLLDAVDPEVTPAHAQTLPGFSPPK
jgi:uncharacterized protein (TIGR00730 family)